MRILLQFPEGLKARAFEIARELERRGDEVLISASPCYGACDVRIYQAEAVKADKIVHYGHAEFPLKVKPPIPIEYVEFRSDVEFRPVLELALAELKGYKAIGVFTTVQHVHRLEEIRKCLEAAGKKVFIGKRGPLAKYDGQILGCDVASALSVEGKVDCFLYFGGGLFHPSGVVIATEKRVLSADPYLNKALWLDTERRRYLRRKKGMLTAGIQARRIGILVSTKPGQFNLEAARRIKAELEGLGKEAYIVLFNRVNMESLTNFMAFDCYINTACPRLVVDEYVSFDKPAMNLPEAAELIGLLKEGKKTPGKMAVSDWSDE